MDYGAILEAQRAYMASDERVRERAALWLDATRQECLAAVDESCAEAEFFLSRLGPDALEQALLPDPLPDETRQLLIRLWLRRAR